MKIGLAIPEQLIGFEPSVLREYAQLAEDLGFGYLTCVDHVLGSPHEGRQPPFPAEGIYTDTSVFHEPLTLFAYLSALTTRVELVTAVLVLPSARPPWSPNRQRRSPSCPTYRLRLGVGSGWNYVEYESLGTDFRTRARRQEEQVLLLRRLWSEPLLDLNSEFHRIDRASINPRLDRPIPIWFGGFSPQQQDRCARIGDGMLWSRDSSLARRGNDAIREKAAALGRDPDRLGFQATVSPRNGESLHQALRTLGSGRRHARNRVSGRLAPLCIRFPGDGTGIRGIAPSASRRNRRLDADRLVDSDQLDQGGFHVGLVEGGMMCSRRGRT